MLKPVVQSIRKFFRIIGMLIMAAIFGGIAWISWQFYERERLLQQFIHEGHPVTVQVLSADHNNREWYDQFMSAAYISFKHEGRTYNIRYAQDSGWVGEGSRITLLYHPGMDAFKQSSRGVHFQRNENRSRLIDFSIVNFYSDERKWHLLAVGFTIATFVILLGIIGNIIHLPWLQRFWGLLATGGVFLFAAYLTYNTAQYYRYYGKIKSTGKVETVAVVRTDYRNHSRRSSAWRSYYATVQHTTGQRLIPIEENDYDRLRPNDRLPVLYSPGLNDMMPVNFQPDHWVLVVVLALWGLGIALLWQLVIKPRRKAAAI